MLEIKEAQRIENLRQKNAENQRKSLLTDQKKEMHQLEAKIDTGRHNLKIKMDKDLIILQKEINLHVADIKCIQGFISRFALGQGETADELRRIKNKSRKTQSVLSESKKVQSKKDSGNAAATITSGRSQSSLGGQNQGAIIVDLLLFGTSGAIKKGGAAGLSMTQSFNNTISSGLGAVNQVMPLRYIQKKCPLTEFEINPTHKEPEGA